MADDVSDEARLTRMESLLERIVSDVGRLVSSERYTIEQGHQDRAIQDLSTNHDKDMAEVRNEISALRRDETNTRRWMVVVFISLLTLVIGVYTKQ